MAKVTIRDFGNSLLSPAAPADFVDGASSAITRQTKTVLEFTDIQGDRFVLKGKGLTYDGNEVTGGTITSAYIYEAAATTTAAEIKDLRVAGAFLFNPHYSGGMSDLWESLLTGNDSLTGSNGIDYIYGGLGNDKINGRGGFDYIVGNGGNDIMTGGGGADVFIVGDGMGIDRIKDFDANGGGSLQDHLLFDAEDAIFRRSGHDVVILFRQGDRVILEDVKLNEITTDDFSFM